MSVELKHWFHLGEVSTIHRPAKDQPQGMGYDLKEWFTASCPRRES
jgi:hypothetical protein